MPRVTPISTLWLWRGISGHSVTFASLFASVLLGFSISKGFHHYLAWLGLGWIYVLIVPVLVFRFLANSESRWIPDAGRRRSIALGILLGSIAVSWGLGWIRERESGHALPTKHAAVP
jgi:hypothetical protein